MLTVSGEVTMTTRTAIRLVSAVVVLFSLLIPAISAGQVFRTSQDHAALQQWTLNLEAYLALREQAAQAVPSLRASASPREILARSAALASEIRARRSRAQAGELFTFEVRRTFRKLIGRVITDHQVIVADLLAEIHQEMLANSAPVVNERFPWLLCTEVPPRLLAALPVLPEELQYRFFGRDLLLFDIDASLVIDILPEAIPRPTRPTLWWPGE
jgi:hypothetical protein